MAQYHDVELLHFDFYLIMLAKELQFPLMTSIWIILMIQMKKSPDWGQSDFHYWVDIMQHFGKHYTASCIQCLSSQGLQIWQNPCTISSTFALPFTNTND